jgi:hypothetical protein
MRQWLRPRGQAGYVVSFIDILFNQIFVFIVIAIVAFVMVNPPIPTEGVKHQNQFVLTLSWDEGDNDLDFWIRYPNSETMFYHNKEVGLLHLDRDDLGYENDTVVIDGKIIVNPVNEEIVSIRGIVPGEYIVNIHFYRSLEHKYEARGLDKPITALVKMDKVLPNLKTVFARRVRFTESRQEMHIMRFTINPDGSVADVTTMMPVRLVDKNNGAYIEQPQFLEDAPPAQGSR